MPYGIFDYVPESFHTMGAGVSFGGSGGVSFGGATGISYGSGSSLPWTANNIVMPQMVTCRDGTRDVTNGFSPACLAHGGVAGPAGPITPPRPPTTTAINEEAGIPLQNPDGCPQVMPPACTPGLTTPRLKGYTPRDSMGCSQPIFECIDRAGPIPIPVPPPLNPPGGGSSGDYILVGEPPVKVYKNQCGSCIDKSQDVQITIPPCSPKASPPPRVGGGMVYASAG